MQEASLASVRPENAEERLGEYEHGILSVVPGDSVCGGPDLGRVRAWMAPRLRQGVVLLADTVEAAWVQMLEGRSEAGAEQAAGASVEAFLEREGALFAGPGCRYQFARASVLLERSECEPFREAVRTDVLAEDGTSTLRGVAEAWVASLQASGTCRMSQGLMRQRALEAMLDHFSVLALLRSQGWGLHLHQGLSGTLRWLNGDQDFTPPGGLRHMVFLELGPRIWP